MAASDFSSWTPVEYDPTAALQSVQASAMDVVARQVAMGSASKEIARLLGSDVHLGSNLTDDTNDGDTVTMYSTIYNGKKVIDEAEADDAFADAITSATFTWLNSMNITHDNASLGVSAARSSTPGDGRPFTSLLNALLTADTEAGYTAGANVTSGAATYANLSLVLSDVESGLFAGNVTDLVVIAHPTLRHSLRGIMDDQNRPIFIDANANVKQDTLFNLPVTWTQGAKETASIAGALTGTATVPLLFVANRSNLVNGTRVAPQARLIPASNNPDSLAHVVQTVARKGFVCTVPQAAAVLRKTA